jgi:hypothetical protein
MNPHEQERASQLGRLWDSLARGDAPSDADAGLLADIQFVQEVTAVPSPPPTTRARIWQGVGDRNLAAAVSTATVAASPNGAAHAPEPVAAPATRRPPAIDWPGLYRLLAIGVLAGMAAGFAAGLWTRIAMRVAGFLTVDRNRGLLTENDAVVGQITFGGTLFLAMFAAVIGVAGGILYMVVRRWLPAHPLVRALSYGVLLFAVFGFVLMDEHNPDYHFFGPPWLNVGTFSLTYVVYGALASLAAERLSSRLPRWTLARSAGWRARFATLAMTPFGAIGILTVLVLLMMGVFDAAFGIPAAIFLLYGLSRVIRLPAWSAGALSPALRRAGALAILVPGLLGFFLTIQGVVGILTGQGA